MFTKERIDIIHKGINDENCVAISKNDVLEMLNEIEKLQKFVYEFGDMLEHMQNSKTSTIHNKLYYSIFANKNDVDEMMKQLKEFRP